MGKITVLVTAGPTREFIDPVRFISNQSSGRMGYEIAKASCKRGYDTILISGPTCLPIPHGVRYVPVVTAADLKREVSRYFPKADILFMTSAVCDFTPVRKITKKIKRQGNLIVQLKKTDDILKSIAKGKQQQVICGFCLETHDVMRHAIDKLKKKKMDLIVATEYSNTANPFGNNKMKAIIIEKETETGTTGVYSKSALARFLIKLTREKINE